MNKTNLLWIVLALISGLAGGYVLNAPDESKEAAKEADISMSAANGPCADGAQPLMWRNPMNPEVTSTSFQKDSMGMDYVPVCADPAEQGHAPAGAVRIDAATTQNMGVRLTTAVQRTLSRNINTVGRITFDETKLVTLHPKVDGWVDKLLVDKTGESVHNDTMLLAFYSPDLVATQEEYLLALSNWQQLKSSPYADIRDSAKRMLDSALDRLRFFDVAEHQIVELQRTHKVRKNMHIHAPAAGVVTSIGVREGARVTPASELYQIADLSRVWVLADLYEYEISWVHVGDTATLRIGSLPGRDFVGLITYIYPYLDAKTRTNKVRIEFDNAEGLLKPDMFGDVEIVASTSKAGVFVPREAVLITGKQAHVFVQSQAGHFEPRTVRTGITADGLIEIIEGVQAGETVVSSGQFLIDSESSIREAAAKMVKPETGIETTKAPRHKEIQYIEMKGMDGMQVELPETQDDLPRRHEDTKQSMDGEVQQGMAPAMHHAGHVMPEADGMKGMNMGGMQTGSSAMQDDLPRRHEDTKQSMDGEVQQGMAPSMHHAGHVMPEADGMKGMDMGGMQVELPETQDDLPRRHEAKHGWGSAAGDGTKHASCRACDAGSRRYEGYGHAAYARGSMMNSCIALCLRVFVVQRVSS